MCTKMKIRILKARRETFWYSQYVGRTFEVICPGIGNDDYKVDTTSAEIYLTPYAFVEKEDAEVIA